MGKIMSEHFLTEIQIDTFKCFKNFKANSLRRVNLISGRNNIGKTAFLEACYLNVFPTIEMEQVAAAIFSILHRRHLSVNRNNLEKLTPFCLLSNIKEIIFRLEKDEAKNRFYYFKLIDKLKKSIEDDNFLEEVFLKSISLPYTNAIKFIKMGFYEKQNLLNAFYKVQEKDKENELNRFIHEFDNSIEVFKVIGDNLRCRVNGIYRDIEDFGEGLLSYLSIICCLYAAENSYLFIDEIENGIHYSHHDHLWNIILTLSKEVNCQVFVTTHSEEVIESFNRVTLAMNEQETTYISLAKGKNKELKAFTFDSKMLAFGLKQEHEIRL